MQRIRYKSICLFLLIISLSLSSCQTKKKKVIYSIYPVQYILSFLAQDIVQMTSLQNEDIITVQAALKKDNSSALLKESGIYFHLGSLEPYNTVLKEEIMMNKQLQSVDLTSSNILFDFGRYVISKKENGKEKFKVVPYYEGEIFKNIDVEQKDLYLWLVPITMLSMAKKISYTLSQLFPEKKVKLQERLAKLDKELINLDAKLQKLADYLIANNKKISFVSTTCSFGSWQKAYGFEVYPLVLSKYGILPNEDQLLKMEETIRQNNVHYIAHEENLSPEMEVLYKTVKTDLNLKEFTLFNLSSKPNKKDSDKKYYISLMYENYNQLETIMETR